MLQKFSLLFLIRFLITLHCPCVPAGAASGKLEETAVFFLESLSEGGFKRAARFCVDPDKFQNWAPPAVTQYLVFPSIRDTHVKDVTVNGDTATVTLSMSAIDFDAVMELGGTLREELLYNLNLSNEYATLDALYEENLVWLIHGSTEFMQEANKHRKLYEIPYVLRDTGEEWKIDLAATLDRWHTATATVTPVSYGTLTYDYAQKRYYADDALYDGLLTCPNDADWALWLHGLTTDEIFSAKKTPVWNVWLRLTAEGNTDGLYGFTVDSVTAFCETLPVAYPDFDSNVIERHWVSIHNKQRAVLEMYIPVKSGLPLPGYTVHYRQRSNIWTPLYYETEHSFPLADVPYDPGCPKSGVSFTVDHLMRVGTVVRKNMDGTITADTLGALMENEYDYEHTDDSIFLSVPEGIADLPIVNSEYALYRLEGTVSKESGDFGVYDVTFALASPVDGIWVEAYEQCSSCDAIDEFDLMGKENIFPETLLSAFDVQVLIRIDGRTDDQLETLLRTLPIMASFSAEKWDFCYEQHGTTTRIGPRTILPVNTSDMVRWAGTLKDLPRAETVTEEE